MEEQVSLERERRSSRKRKRKVHFDELQVEKSEEEGIAEDENPRKLCKVCNKEFESGRALGGHMRAHAQEPGSQRSINGNGDGFICSSTKFSRSLDDSSHNFRSRRGFDLASHITGWAITGKRGRGGSMPAPDMDMMETAETLLLLSTGSGLWEKTAKKKTGRKEVEVQVDTRSVYPVAVPGAGDGFECVTGSNKFSTYQALGGHRSKNHFDREGNGVAVESCFFQPGPRPPSGSGNSAECLAGQVLGLCEAAQLADDVNCI